MTLTRTIFWTFFFVLLIGVSLYLIQFGHMNRVTEGFAVAAVDPGRMPACVERSTAAQSLLARFADIPNTNEDAEELRLLVSKLCCISADITAPTAGMIRTVHLQFRTSHDLEPASTTVGRCLGHSLPLRDIELAQEKYLSRGKVLINNLLSEHGNANEKINVMNEFESVVNLAISAFKSCAPTPPVMDHPSGVRDMGYWESSDVANLSAYKGISASP